MINEEQLAEVQKDQKEKLQQVIEKITPFCKEDSEYEEFRKMAAALKDGDKLDGESLEGSSNYSYKVFLEKDPECCVFVKVSFTFALWNPDRSAYYSLERLTTEYKMLKKFSDLLGDKAPVAKPYFCTDITPEIRMLVAQWAPSHEPWGSQFLRGKVDRRIIPKVAEFVAMINLSEIEDSTFNEEIKNPMRSLYPIVKAIFDQLISAEGEPDHFIAAAREIGLERFSLAVDRMGEEYEKCEMLLHGDTHCLNVLVEPLKENGEFGDKGEFFVCDWEMVHPGVKGRDSGTFNAFPIVSSYFLAAQGLKEEAKSMISVMREFWDLYAQHMVEKGNKDDDYMKAVFRSSLAWCGVYSFIANVILKAQWNFFPFDKISPEAGAKVIASLSLTGMKFMEFGFLDMEPDFSIPQMREWMEERVIEQIDFLAELYKDSQGNC